MKKIVVIIDGGADRPIKFFEGKTVFESAKLTNLDSFTENGSMGYMYPINEKKVPGSDNSLMAIFGNDPMESRRGIFEAMGLNINLKKSDLALRANFGTINNLKTRVVEDRRAGRTLTSYEANQLANDINKHVKIPAAFKFIPSIQHRGVLILHGGFSEKISNIDNEWGGKKQISFSYSKPLDDDMNSKYTSDILNLFIEQSFKVLNNHPVNVNRKKKGLLPANFIFLRGPGNQLPKMSKFNKWLSINSMPLEIGISKALGMDVVSYKFKELRNFDVYNNLYKNLKRHIRFSKKQLKKNWERYDGFYIHFKEADIPGHDNKPIEKRKMIELIDRKFFGWLEKFLRTRAAKLVVTCDHATPCEIKAHSSDIVPVLIYDKENKDSTYEFTEYQARKGSLGKMYGKEFLKKTGLG